MPTRRETVTAKNLPRWLEELENGTGATQLSDPNPGIFLHGTSRGRSRITGQAVASFQVPGSIVIETEHGRLYVPCESILRITIEDGDPLQWRSPGALFAINDLMAAHLGERYGWYANSVRHDHELDQMTHDIARLIDTLLENAPVGDDQDPT